MKPLIQNNITCSRDGARPQCAHQRIAGATPSATKKRLRKFGIRDAEDHVIDCCFRSSARSRSRGENMLLLYVSVGAFIGQKGSIKCDILSTPPPVLLHGTKYVPISTEVPRMMYKCVNTNVKLDDVNLDGSQSQQKTFCAKA